LGFPASQIHDLYPVSKENGSPPLMTVAFIGLTGPSGVLPTHYSELVIEETRADGDEGPLGAFLDMFHHRLISLFYRAWERNHPHLSPNPEARASFHGYLLALIGESLDSTNDPHPVESLRLLRHTGLWAQKRRSAEGLRILLLDRLNHTDEPVGNRGNPIEVEIIPFVPRWILVDEERRLTLRRSEAGSGIGQGAILGSRARDWQGRFRVRIGPLTVSQFRRLQPPPRSRNPRSEPSTFRELVEIIWRYVGPEFSFEIVLVLRADEIPPCQFDRDLTEPVLGRCWLTTRTPDQDVEAIFPAPTRHSDTGAVRA